MAVKVISKDLIPKYYLCEQDDGNRIIAHENIVNYNILPITVSKRTKDITDEFFGEWYVLHYIGDRKWLCQCSCGRLCGVTGYNLMYGKSLSCGHEKFTDLKEQQFGDWEVLEFAGTEHGMSLWKCKCSCGNIKDVYAAKLLSGRSKSCGHDTNKFNDLKDKQFGEWTALEYIGNHYWKCRCSCGTIKDIAGYSLTRGDSKSCGHLASDYRKETMINRYGDYMPNKSRDMWQIDVLLSKENMLEHILKRGYKPTAEELSKELGINTNNIYKYIHKYGLDDYIYINYNSSKYETEIVDIIKALYNVNIIQRCKTVIPGIELDIYIPEKHIAIEFNGSYWHSELHKDKLYHQNKTLLCAKKGIRLIHIFEYEWIDEELRAKLINLVAGCICNNKVRIGARKTIVKDIDRDEAKIFCNKYHLQGYSNSSINIGCFYNDELIGVITLGTPRFNKKYQYEVIRLCWKDNVSVIGGAGKLFKYFVNKYNADSVISYCNIDKFAGNSYLKIGFKASINNITTPNYVWYNPNKKDILTRYQTQKNKLISMGLGKDDETESDIMYRLGYVRIYDSGNIILEWRNHNGS